MLLLLYEVKKMYIIADIYMWIMFLPTPKGVTMMPYVGVGCRKCLDG